jgi:hypothetical protein
LLEPTAPRFHRRPPPATEPDVPRSPPHPNPQACATPTMMSSSTPVTSTSARPR